MKALDIEAHLRAILPTKISGFSKSISVSAAAVASNVMTVTATNHSLKVNDTISLIGIQSTQALTFISVVGIQAAFTSASSNDLTLCFNNSVTLESNDANYNGDFRLVAASERKNLAVEVALFSDDPTDPVNLVEKDLANLNEVFQVASVIDANNFTVVVSYRDTVDLGGGEIVKLSKVNVASDIDADRFSEVYTKQAINSNWLLITPNGSSISRSRNINSDFSERIEGGDDIQLQSQETFSIFAFIPTGDKINGIAASDYCRNELKIALLKCLLGWQPEKVFNASYDLVNFLGDAPDSYDTNTYAHRYEFSVTSVLNANDAYFPSSLALNKINIDYFKENDLKASDSYDFTKP